MLAGDADDASRNVHALVAAEMPSVDDQPATIGWLQRMCRVAARELPADGVGVSLISAGGNVLTAAASGPRSVVLEELQFTLGEGPCLTAYAARKPVLVPDLGAARGTWPGYAAAAGEHQVRAVFAFPLQVGSVRVGALDVYRDQPGNLSETTLAQAVTFAESALEGLLRATATSDPDGGEEVLLDTSGTRFEVYQAQGKVMAQLGVAPEQAMLRLRAHAFVSEQRLADVADAILAGSIVLEPDDL